MIMMMVVIVIVIVIMIMIVIVIMIMIVIMVVFMKTVIQFVLLYFLWRHNHSSTRNKPHSKCFIWYSVIQKRIKRFPFTRSI